jgi:SAM-dependent methyltransferase
MSDVSRIFTDIYNGNRWKTEEGCSGIGSTLANTKSIREWLPELIKTRKIKSILDVGCGDLNWMSKIEIGIPYIGIDVVPDLIKKNIEIYSFPFRPTKRFLVLDATSDEVPKADLVVIRCVLYHLSYANITRIIKNVLASEPRYVLITNCKGISVNRDSLDGGYRKLDFTKPPFSFPSPSAIYNDDNGSNEEMRLYTFKKLSVWNK